MPSQVLKILNLLFLILFLQTLTDYAFLLLSCQFDLSNVFSLVYYSEWGGPKLLYVKLEHEMIFGLLLYLDQFFSVSFFSNNASFDHIAMYMA